MSAFAELETRMNQHNWKHAGWSLRILPLLLPSPTDLLFVWYKHLYKFHTPTSLVVGSFKSNLLQLSFLPVLVAKEYPSSTEMGTTKDNPMSPITSKETQEWLSAQQGNLYSKLFTHCFHLPKVTHALYLHHPVHDQVRCLREMSSTPTRHSWTDKDKVSFTLPHSWTWFIDLHVSLPSVFGHLVQPLELSLVVLAFGLEKTQI